MVLAASSPHTKLIRNEIERLLDEEAWNAAVEAENRNTLSSTSASWAKAEKSGETARGWYRGEAVFIPNPAGVSGHRRSIPITTSVLQHVQASTLRALGVTTLKRIRPDIPAIAETLPGFEASSGTAS